MADEKKALDIDSLEVTELSDDDLEGVAGGSESGGNDSCPGPGPNDSCAGCGPNDGCTGPGSCDGEMN